MTPKNMLTLICGVIICVVMVVFIVTTFDLAKDIFKTSPVGAAITNETQIREIASRSIEDVQDVQSSLVKIQDLISNLFS